MNKKLFSDKIEYIHLQKHETKKNVLIKFFLVASIFLVYLFFISMQYGLQDGFFVCALTWSFFVLCTPIADAGFLIDFPLRLVTNMRMLISEILVWCLAILINIYAYFFVLEIYEKTKLLSFFKHILEQPIPFWSIIVLSMIGTFISIQFGDELLDKVSHHEREIYKKHGKKYRWIIMIFLFIITFILYDFLLKELGINVLI